MDLAERTAFCGQNLDGRRKRRLRPNKKGAAENCSIAHLESQLQAHRSRIRATILREIAAGISRPDHREVLLAIALEYDSAGTAGDNRAKAILEMFRA